MDYKQPRDGKPSEAKTLEPRSKRGPQVATSS